MNYDSIWQTTRYLLIAVLTALATNGFISSDQHKEFTDLVTQLNVVIPAVGALATMGWGLWAKWGTSPVPDKVIEVKNIPVTDSATGKTT